MRQKRVKQIRKIASLLVYTSPELGNDEHTIKKATDILKKKYKNNQLLEFLRSIKRNEQQGEELENARERYEYRPGESGPVRVENQQPRIL